MSSDCWTNLFPTARILRSRASRSWHSPSARRSLLLQTLGSPSPPGFDGGVRGGGVEGATARRADWLSHRQRERFKPTTTWLDQRLEQITAGQPRSRFSGQEPVDRIRW
jgi:hypothetical protein